MTLTWEDVVARQDLIGGDIESVEGGNVYRGPLARIWLEGDDIHTESPWMARLNRDTGNWELGGDTSSFVSAILIVDLVEISGGRVFARTMFGDYFTIFPRGGSRLDPSRVEGLPNAAERLLALYPDLEFDYAVIERVCHEVGFRFLPIRLQARPEITTMQGVLSLFGSPGVAEDFLIHFIEASTGENAVHLRVY